MSKHRSDAEETMEEAGLTVQPGDTYRCRREDGTYCDAVVVKLRKDKRTGREQYYVHYADLSCHQAEWVDRAQLVLSAKEEEDMEDGTEQKIYEETTQNPGESSESEQDKPKAKRIKIDTSVMVCEDEKRTCVLCSGHYEDHVMAECGHSFCRSCIHKAYASPDSLSCPDCKKVITEKKSTPDITSENMADTTAAALTTLPLGICPEHDEKLKLYCKDDGALCCVICRDSLAHINHKFLTVMDAVIVCRAELTNAVSPLEEALKKVDELRNREQEKKEQLQNTMTEYRQHVTSEFENLYNYLKERKEKLLKQLKEQSLSLLEEMETNAVKMEEKRESVKETIAVANQKMEEMDSVSFLDGIKYVLNTSQEQTEALSSMSVTEKELCRGTFQGPIQYIAWKQMKSVFPECETQLYSPRKDKYSERTMTPRVPRKKVESPESPVNPLVLKNSEPALIFLVGNNYLNAAKLLAQMGHLGLNLGFDNQVCTVHWFGMNRHCGHLFRILKEASKTIRSPDVVFFHAGSNNLKRAECSVLISTIETDLNKAANLFPNTEFILSSLYPKTSWWENPGEQTRDRIYSCLSNFVERPRFRLLEHDELEERLMARCADTDVNILTYPEKYLFLKSIRDALQDTINKGYKPSVKTCEELPSEGFSCEEAQCRDDAIEPDQPSAGTITNHKEILIIGSGFMTAAECRAKNGPLGLNLGFDKQTCTLHWRSQVKTWFDVYPNLKSKSIFSAGNPDILLFYLGCNELEQAQLKKLNNCVKSCLSTLAKFYPNTQVILSVLLPEPAWFATSVDFKRKGLNFQLTERAKRPFFHLLQHHELEKKLTERYAEGDRSSITETETDLFLNSIRDSLQKAMFKIQTKKRYTSSPRLQSYKPSIEKFEVLPSEKSPATKSKEIWIVGSGFMVLAKRRAQNGSLGLNLGFEKQICTIVWKNLSRTWLHLFHKLKEQSRNARKPDVIVFHSGSHDLEQGPVKSLAQSVLQCLNSTANFFRHTEFIFSTLLPKPEQWKAKMECQRKEFNYLLVKRSQVPRFYLLRHYELEKMLIDRFTEGCISDPTDAEIDLFLADIRDHLQKTIFKDYKPSDETCLPSEDVQSEEEQSNSANTSIEPDQPSAGNEVYSAITRHKEIWIVGSDYMMAANRRAEIGPLGFNLGFNTQTCIIQWWNVGKTMSDLFPRLKQQTKYAKSADVMMIYTGSLDLGHLEFNTLKKNFEDCLNDFEKFYPNAEFIISTLLPQPRWLGTAVEHRLKEFNSFLTGYTEKPRFHLLNLDEMEKKLIDKYAAGGDGYLNDAESDLLIARIRDALLKALYKDYEPSVESCEELPSENIPSEDVKCEGSVKDHPSSAMEVEVAVRKNLQHVTPMGRYDGPEASEAIPAQKQIWIMGDSYIHRASLLARKGLLGENLGFDEQQWGVRWMGKIDQQIILTKWMHKFRRNLGQPSIVYLHVGGSDLVKTRYHTLIKDFAHDFRLLSRSFPKTQFILSTILPTPEWLFSPLEECRKRVNLAICENAEKRGFLVAKNGKLEQVLLQRFRKRRVSATLNYHDNKTFLESIKISIEKAIRKNNKRQKLHKEVLSTGGNLIVVVPGNDPTAPTEEDQEDVEEMASGSDDTVPIEEYERAREKKAKEWYPRLTYEEAPQGAEDPSADPSLPNILGADLVASTKEDQKAVEAVKTSGVKQIWIVGNSYICRAARQASRSSYCSNFGFDLGKWTVRWMGQVGMRWEALLPELNNALSTLGAPSIVFIHLGDNDLGCMPHDTLMTAMKGDLSQISKLFPNTEFVFSTILPRAEWLTNLVEQNRQDINAALIECVAELGFHVTTHEDIEEKALSRFKSGGSSAISDSEYDLFIKGIKDAMEAMILKVESAPTV